jgi:hypothetical protein
LSESNKNTELWESVENTNSDYMKKVSTPFPHISIDAQYQILTATKLWGPYGNKWGVRNEIFTTVMTGNDLVCNVIYTASLYYPDGEFPINSDIFMYRMANGKPKVNNDYIKKVSTDALTKGLSKLGFSADVFMGKYEGNKYEGINLVDPDNTDPKPATEDQIRRLNEYLPLLEKNFPDKYKYLDKMLKTNLMEDDAFDLLNRSAKITGVKK